jgi:hypothetical protein
MRARETKKPKCTYCHTVCFGIGFQGELHGGCAEQKEWQIKLRKKRNEEANKIKPIPAVAKD